MIETDEKAMSLSEKLERGDLVSRGDVFAAPCPSRQILNHVSSRWSVLILIALREGTHRFSQLRKRIGGVSEKMLAQNLQQLTQYGFVNRVSHPVVPPHVEYNLTPLGQELAVHVSTLADWIELNYQQINDGAISEENS